MGKVNIFQITLNNYQAVYYPGQSVEGYCTVELTEELTYRGIRLQFLGKAKVSWKEENTSVSGGSVKSKTEEYKDTEQYFNRDVLLTGVLPNQGNNKSRLGMGRHTFPFSFELPDTLPSSFEGKYGYVRYSITGTIDRPGKLFDDECTKFFTVVRNLDLNENPTASYVQNPTQGRDEKMVCCCCCASGPVEAEFRLERTGYVPGEPIPLEVTISNNSRRAIDQAYVSLVAVTIFHSTKKDRTSTKEVCRMKPEACAVAAGQTTSWKGQQFVLPPMPPSYLQGCNIIDTRYFLQLYVDPSYALPLEVGLDVVIGTIPLRQYVEAFPPRAAADMPPPQAGYPAPSTMYPPIEGASASSPPVDTPAAPLATTMPVVTPPSGIPNLPPPMYKKCPLNKQEEDEDDSEPVQNELYCVPFYPIYDWGYKPSNDSL